MRANRPVGDRRPQTQRRTSGGVATREDLAERRVRRTGLTSRAAVLAVAVCAVLLTLAVPLQQYVAQRAQINDLAAKESEHRNRVEELQTQELQWQDPAYIRQQAKQRLHFVKPGETAYVIVDPSTPSTQTTLPPSEVADRQDDRPWFSQLWSTVVTAGAEPTQVVTPAKNAPVPKASTPKPINPDSRQDKH